MVKFPDDTQVGLISLDHIMAEIYNEGRQPNEETVNYIIKRLEEKNYIPQSGRVRNNYSYVLLNEYRKFFKKVKEGNMDKK